MFPVMLQLDGRQALVVGGGGVALRKILGLLDENADVTVVAPEVVATVTALADDGRITLRCRSYTAGEVAGYALAFAATDDREVNRRVFEDATAAGVWVNVADDPELCSFHLPSCIRRGPFLMALASGGAAPFAIRRLRRSFERWIGPEWGEWLEAAARFRNGVRGLSASSRVREALFDRFFEATVDSEARGVRVPSPGEVEGIFEGVGRERSAERVAQRPNPIRDRETEEGFVSLVGGGPGNAGLLTLTAHRRLMAADVVVYDRLAAPALPCDLPARIELRCVGKTAGRHPVPQEEIDAMLIRLAREGRRVVRLKGGDPFVFGRGGEEAEALAAAGIPFEVVPGVTSGIAGPAWAGIPVTHRREAVRLTLVTAHECSKDEPQIRWDLLAQDPSSTLVAYMGVAALPNVVKRLLEGGMNPEMPAALIERATTGSQRTVTAAISGLREAAETAGIRPPALIVVGPTVRHTERLDWTTRFPLAGRRVLVRRGVEWADPLEWAGAEVVAVPLPLNPAARVVIEALPLTDVVLRNRGEVEALDIIRGGVGWGPEVVSWCLTGDAFERACDLGWNHVERLESEGRSDELVERLAAAPAPIV